MVITDPPTVPRRRRVSKDTRRQLVARYQRSDLTQRAFCEQVGLPISTLQWWLAKLRRETGRTTPVAFAEVTMPAEVKSGCEVDLKWAVEVETRTGVTLRLREPLTPALLRLLLRRA